MTKTIDMTPTWTTAAAIYATALRDGTDKGREMAYAEVLRMGRMIDELQQQLDNQDAELAELHMQLAEIRKGDE